MKNTGQKDKNFPELRKKAEARLKHKSETCDNGAASDLERELSVHEIALQMQNEALLATQARLTSSLKEYEELFEFSPVGYFILDEQGIIEKANAAGCCQLALGRAELVGKPFSIFINGEYHQDNFYKHRMLVMESEKQHPLQCEITNEAGATFPALIRSTYLKDEDSTFKHLLSIVNDISEMREYEQQIELALKKSRELNELKSRFVTMASHEFRTPLSSVLSSTWLLEQYLKTGDEEKIKKHLDRIRSSIEGLTVILNDFLSLEKIESGFVKIERHSYNLSDFCKDAIEEVRGILKTGQRINYTHAGDEIIKEDKKILQHIMQNLLSNACKYSEENKEITLSSEVSENAIILQVMDHGIGIPDEEKKNVFTRFFRAQNAVNIQGTGLGLNIAKKYVEMLGGNIDFTSQLGLGTTFVVTLPHDISGLKKI